MRGTIRSGRRGAPGGVARPARMLALAGGVTAAGAALWLGPVHQLPAAPAPLRLPWPLFALGFAASTAFAARLDVRRPAHSFALSELPLVLGLYLLAPGELVVARLAGSLAALALPRRQGLTRVAFDLAAFLLETCLAVTVFAALAGGHPLGPRSWAAALLATLAADLLNALADAAASSLYEGRSQWRMLLDAAGAGAVGTVANTSLALVAVMALSADLRAAVPLAVVAGVLLVAYRGYGSLRHRHRRLERLYSFTRTVSRATEVDATVRILLEQARSTLRAEVAELLLRERDGGGARLLRLAADGRLEVTGTTGGGPLLDVPGAAAAVHPRPIRDERIRAEAARRGLRDAVVVVLPGAAGPLGTLLVGNRPSQLGSFDAEDGRLLETMANQAGVALEKARVLDRLRMEAAERTLQALHDPLTGLGNRRRFLEELVEAIAAAPPGGLTVLLLDLDRFKEINDTLGREAGDRLLLEVADRLVATAAGAELVARLGGDEFALLAGGSGPGGDARLAERLQQGLAQPVRLDGMDLEVAATIGMARWPQHGDDPETLLQRAEVAMYQAKADHSGVGVYDEARDPSNPERLAIVGELRAAIDAGQVAVWYQPKAEAASGRLVGAEALVRWPHPTRGAVPPDVFVPIAEHAGLIGRLTRLALAEALAACQSWRAAGLDLGVAVNLSARGLLVAGLADQVAGLLAATGLPASCLTLEITESQVMTDPDRAVPVLERLRDLGVHLAVDDFGTGYSSLGYLRELPVDEVKIDRSFVLGMADDAADAGIVEAAVALGRCLGLRVVAEGVEDDQPRLRLAEMGCQVVQGFLVGRPMPADRLLRHALDRSAARPVRPVQGP